MKYLRTICINFLAALIVAAPCLAAVVTAATVPATRATGNTITATIWNSDVLGLYTYLNNNIVPVLNTLTTKGDIYVYTGSAIARQGVGSNGNVLTADSAQTNGIKWAALADTASLTTKGDLLGYSSAPIRIPVGSNGNVLIADSTVSAGIKWGTPTTSIPKGAINAWSPAAAGTNTIPTGWLLCDGTNSTPNLIGRFIIGTRPSGSTATASSGGYGVETVDSNGTGITTHSHTVGQLQATSTPSATTTVQSGTGANVGTDTHYHTITVGGTSTTVSHEPADYALVYIIKQ
jgi:hypothetical protein